MYNTFRFFSFIGLLSIIIFFFKNIMQIKQGGVGYEFLFLFVILGLFLFIFRVCLNGNVYICLSFLFLLLFFSYFLLKMEIDLHSINRIKSYTIGTTGGIYTAYLLGALSFLLIQSLLFDCNIKLSSLRISNYYIFFLICFYFFFVVQSLFVHLSELRSDIIIIQSSAALYQRPGDFICMSFVIISLLVLFVSYLNFSHAKTHNKMILIFIHIFYFFCIFPLFLLGQMIGSNKVLFFVFALSLINISFLCNLFFLKYEIRNSLFISEGKMLYNPKYFIKSVFGNLFKSSFLSFSLICLFLYFIISITKFDISSLRIMGFGYSYGDPFSSFTSRIVLFKNNFLVHFDYSPLLGNMRVDSLTTGTGSYVHSFLFSILTHLGIIGLILFIIPFSLSLTEILKSTYPLALIFPDNYHIFIRAYILIMLLLILSMANIAAFFSWMPFWFSLGIFSTPIYFDKNC